MSTVPTETKLVLGPRSAGILMTPEEFDAVDNYNERYRYELINGVLVVTPIPSGEETGPNELLSHWLLMYKETNRRGSALDATLPQQYVRTRRSRRLADRLIWTGLGRMPDREQDLPTIAVEFVSAGRRYRERDYQTKRREYLKLGIAEYWVVDRFQRTLTDFCRTKPQRRVIREDESYQTSLLPGFELPLARLLAAADHWARRKK
jgi:Uma2 family endonuclease